MFSRYDHTGIPFVEFRRPGNSTTYIDGLKRGKILLDDFGGGIIRINTRLSRSTSETKYFIYSVEPLDLHWSEIRDQLRLLNEEWELIDGCILESPNSSIIPPDQLALIVHNAINKPILILPCPICDISVGEQAGRRCLGHRPFSSDSDIVSALNSAQLRSCNCFWPEPQKGKCTQCGMLTKQYQRWDINTDA